MSDNIFAEQSEKSPYVSFGLSFVLPGGGQFYNGQYVKSSIFFGIFIYGLGGGYAAGMSGDKTSANIAQTALVGSWLLSWIDAPISSSKINKRINRKKNYMENYYKQETEKELRKLRENLIEKE